MAELVYKVVRKREDGTFQSASPARLRIVTRTLDVVHVADVLHYEIGKWTEALPNSMGIFIFFPLDYALSWCASDEVVLECEYKGELKRVWLAVDVDIKDYCLKEKWEKFMTYVYEFGHNVQKDFVRKELGIRCIWTPLGTFTVRAIKPIRVIEQGGNNG